MTQCLTKNNSAFTLIELMMAVTVSVLLLTGVYGFYTASSQSYSSGISGQALQDGADIVLSKIIEGDTESNTVYRLSTSMAYRIACATNCASGPVVDYTCGGVPQTAPCNASQPYGEIYFCQENPCTQSGNIINDPTARWYYVNSTGTAVMYHYPGEVTDEIIYTAPPDVTLSLRFSVPQVTITNPLPPQTITIPNDVEIDVALTKNLSANVTNQRLAVSGTASTYVLMRNH